MPDFFIRSLIRVASLQGRDVLEAIITGQFTTVATNGGKQLTGVAAGGKSFTYTVPQSLSVEQLMAKAEQALEYFDGLDSDQIDNLLTRAPITRTVATFAS